MVEHIVLFKFRPETGEAEKSAIVVELNALRYKIPDILSLSCGPNFSDRNQCDGKIADNERRGGQTIAVSIGNYFSVP